jgi:hypothetical protein
LAALLLVVAGRIPTYGNGAPIPSVGATLQFQQKILQTLLFYHRHRITAVWYYQD